jgi:hypothetical protein
MSENIEQVIKIGGQEFVALNVRAVEPSGVVKEIIDRMVRTVETLEDDYHDDLLSFGTGRIRRLCDLIEEADKHRDLRIQLCKIDSALREKLGEILSWRWR